MLCPIAWPSRVRWQLGKDVEQSCIYFDKTLLGAEIKMNKTVIQR